MKFSVNIFFSKLEQFRSFLRTCSHLLKKFLTENYIFCAVCEIYFIIYLFIYFYYAFSNVILQ